MSARRYSTFIVLLLAVVFGGLLATDSVFLCVDQLARNYPWRSQPPLSGMGPFVDTYGQGDAILGSFPALAYVHQALQNGALPLWNPLEGLGLPSVASFGLGYMFPVHWLTYGLLHPLLAWHVELVMVVLLSSISSFAVFRRLSGSDQAAALAATAWTFGGWSSAYWQLPSYAWSLALFPFALLGLERIFEKRPLAHLQLATSLALLLTVGHLQMVLPIAAILAAWTLLRGPRHRWPVLASMSAAGLMASFHLLPMIELLRLSERARAPLANVLNALLLPREYLCMVFPSLMGQPSDNFYFGTLLANPVINGREHCVFAGVITLCLALLAVVRASDRASRPIFAVSLACLLLAGAPPVYGLLCRLVPAALFLTPTRFLPFVLFGFCLLAAQGWASLSNAALSRREANALTSVLLAFSAGALLFILPAMLLTADFQAWLLEMATKNYAAKPPFFEGNFGPVFVQRVLDHFSLTSPPIATSFAVVIATIVLLRSKIGKAMPFLPVMLILCLDLAVFCATMNPPSPAAAYFPKNADIAYLSRGTRLEPGRNAPARAMSQGEGPYPNLLLVEGISNLEAYESAHPGDYRAVIDALNEGFELDHQSGLYVGDSRLGEGTLDVVGLGKLMNPAKDWDPRFGLPDYRGALWIQDRPTALRAFTIDKYRLGNRAQHLQSLMAPGFEPRAEVLLDAAPSYPSPNGPSRFQSVEPSAFAAEQVEFEIKSDHPTVLVLTDLHYPGWTVTVNGQPRPLLKAYGFARAVEIGAGDSTVSMSFRPTGYPWAPWLSILTFLGFVALELGLWKVRKSS